MAAGNLNKVGIQMNQIRVMGNWHYNWNPPGFQQQLKSPDCWLFPMLIICQVKGEGKGPLPIVHCSVITCPLCTSWQLLIYRHKQGTGKLPSIENLAKQWNSECRSNISRIDNVLYNYCITIDNRDYKQAKVSQFLKICLAWAGCHAIHEYRDDTTHLRKWIRRDRVPRFKFLPRLTE